MKINYMAPINTLGYGVAGLNILKGLTKLLNEVTLFPISVEVANQEDVPLIQYCINNQDDYDYRAPCIRLWHQFALAETVGSGQRIGFPIFELDTFTPREKHHLQSLDKIFVCSKWAKEVVAQNGITTPTYVVPLGVDRTIFNENVKFGEELYNLVSQGGKINQDTTIFLHMGKWEIRKGADVIVEAFNRAFTKQDNVHLIMACYNPFIGEKNVEWERLYKSSKLGDKITILPRLKTQYDVAAVMQLADVGLFPARAEGWNLELLEMMALGKEVICTDFSAHTEFADSCNASLIDVKNTESAYDGIWFHGNGNWAELGEYEITQMIDYMKYLKKTQGNRTVNLNGIETSKRFSWENSAKNVIIGVES